VVLSVAVGTEQNALVCFGYHVLPSAIGERSCVQLKDFQIWLAMMKFKRSKVSRVAADTAAAAQFEYRVELPDPASFQLPAIALMVVVRVPVLAAP